MIQPVVIIGAGRSGTKFLRDTLAGSSLCCAVPFDVNYVWRYRHERLPDDVIPAEELKPETQRYIRRTLERLAHIGTHPGCRYLVEKTVSNSLRVPYIDAILPTAKFIHLIRDGREVVESAARMWRQPPSWHYLLQKLRYFPLSNYRYGFWYLRNLMAGALQKKRGQRIWGPRYPGIEDDLATKGIYEICALQWRACVEQALSDLEMIPEARKITVRYEQLVSNEEAISRVCDFLGLDDSDRVIAVYSKTLRRDTREKWKTNIPEEDMTLVLRELNPTLDRLHYLASPASGSR